MAPTRLTRTSPRLLPATEKIATAAALSARTLGSRTKLRPMHMPLFDVHHPPLLAEVGRAVCTAEVLPRKELYEAWEVATRVDAAFPMADRVADLAAGHGLLAWLLLLLARDRGCRRTAVCVDVRMPVSADTLAGAITRRFPEVASDLHYVEGGIEAIEPSPAVLLTAIHACGPLSDDVLHAALGGGAAVALLPCCHSLHKQRLVTESDPAYEALAASAAERGMSCALDDARLGKMVSHGYDTRQLYISSAITPYNRLLLGAPSSAASAAPSIVDAAALHRPTVASASKGQAVRLRRIPLADVAAIAALSGRRPKEWSRWLEVSVWQPSGAPPTVAALAELARRASRARWRPKQSSPGKQSEQSQSDEAEAAPFWSTDAALAAARLAERGGSTEQRALDSREAEDDDVMDGGGPAQPPRVEVDLREEYHAPGGRRACLYRITFTRRGMAHTSQVTKGDLALWQNRVREALMQWAFEDGGFELR